MSRPAAIIIHPSGDTDPLAEISLATLGEAVGGYVQALELAPDLTAWIDEEGKLKSYPLNPKATLLVKHSGHGLLPGDYIAGACVFTGGTDQQGETLPLGPTWQAFLTGQNYSETEAEAEERNRA